MIQIAIIMMVMMIMMMIKDLEIKISRIWGL